MPKQKDEAILPGDLTVIKLSFNNAYILSRRHEYVLLKHVYFLDEEGNSVAVTNDKVLLYVGVASKPPTEITNSVNLFGATLHCFLLGEKLLYLMWPGINSGVPHQIMRKI